MNKKALLKIAELEDRVATLEEYINAAVQVHEAHEKTQSPETIPIVDWCNYTFN